ncbi:Golgi-associated kinase 1B-like [Antedon mediterranea]|uniref:Golgi-associated kinase 1B-like n=1 Tax=Antedon mediterranea TaxID=105859 RepID=UPI003AF8E856
MRWRHKLYLSRRLRKIIYVATVSVMISLAIYNQFGENVIANSRKHLASGSRQGILQKQSNNNEDLRKHKLNQRSLKRLTLDRSISNVHYVTIEDTRKHTPKPIVRAKKEDKVELKRMRERDKRAIRSKFHYTQTSIGEDRSGLFDSPLGLSKNIRKTQNMVQKSAAYVKGSIRFFAKPEWFSVEDINSMITLSEDKDVLRISNLELTPNDINWKTLRFTHETHHDAFQHKAIEGLGIKPSDVKVYGLTSHSLSLHEVLAFHLDRVLGLRRVMPTVAKRMKGNVARTLNIPENSLHSVVAMRNNLDIQAVGDLLKQDVLSCKNVQLSDISRSRKCGGIDGLEWGKLALFDFLLQNHNRLNKHCCGIQPAENECLNTVNIKDCSNTNIGTVHKSQNSNQLLFLKNDMNIIRSEKSVDFEILNRVRKFPVGAVDIMRKGKLKLKLLQSLFIDKAYWDGVGGRPGIEHLLNVIVDRAKIFLYYYDTHIQQVQ